ncbi:MAG: hypothetical protein HY459_04700 [Parcubacteria group bacterium]|nr:hypothetical protein [Parcubacteria group bacterium]
MLEEIHGGFLKNRHLSLESLDTGTGIRVIINTLTGQRLQMTPESMEILGAFRVPRTLTGVARYLGVRGRGSHRQFQSLVLQLMDASFLINASDVAGHEQRNLRTIIDLDSFVHPKTLFAHCPSVNVTK